MDRFPFWKIHKNDVKEIAYLFVKNNGDPNIQDSKGRTILHRILKERPSQEAVRQLVSNGAPLNIKDKDGMTPLHTIVKNADSGHEKIIKYLLECGADSAIKNNEGQTALDIACAKVWDEKKYIEIIKEHNKKHKAD